MNTKIVYAVASDESDIFLEQVILSVFSLKYHNPSCHSVLVVDNITNKTLEGARKDSVKYFFNELVSVDVPANLTKKQRSRWLKTTLRNHVIGNYLFIDSDTIITASLSEIDNMNEDIMAVLDRHVKVIDNVARDSILRQASYIGWDFSIKDERYFNSGVMFVKESPYTHMFYDNWNKKWMQSMKDGLDIDQPALGYTNQQSGYAIQELSGIWNCQIMGNGIKYLNDAKILHYYNSNIGNKTSSYAFGFADPKIYYTIKNNNYLIDENIKEMVLHAKGFFSDNIEILSGNHLKCYRDVVVQFVQDQYFFHKKIYKILRRCILIYLKIKNNKVNFKS